MSENNSSLNLGDGCLIVDETDRYLVYNSILPGGIKDKIHPYQNINDINQSYYNEDFSVDADNVFEIKTEKDYRNTGIHNPIFVKEEIDIKKEIFTYQTNDDINGSYHTEKSNANSVKNGHGQLYDCNICHKSFTQKGTLNRHMIIHTGKKPFKCDICFKSFTQKGNLKDHMVNHTSKKPFKCDICMKSFGRKVSLSRHAFIHTDERPYFKCDICMKSFTQKGTLNRHMVIHTSIKQ